MARGSEDGLQPGFSYGDALETSIISEGEDMSKIKRKVPETLEFVKGLLISADTISNSLSEELEPRKVLAQKPTKIARLEPEQIQELGKYQGRVVLVALAAELALKFVWETENQGGAAGGHDLLDCFDSLSDDIKGKLGTNIRDALRTRSEKSGGPLIRCSRFAVMLL